MERVDQVVSSPTRLGSTVAQLSLTLSRITFAATVVLIPFRMRLVLLSRLIDPIYQDYTDILLFASDLFLLATLVFWFLNLVTRPRRLKIGPLFLFIPLVGLIAMAAVSSIVSIDPLVSFDHTVRLIVLAAFYFYVLNEVKFDQLILPVAAMIGIQAVVGISQVLEQHSLGLKNLQELQLNPAWSGVSIVLAQGVRSLRAYGLTDHPNILGGCLAFGLVLIGVWSMGSKTRWQTLITTCFVLGALALLVTFSRSAWLAMLSGLGLCLILFFATRQREPVVRWLNLMGGALLLLLPFIWHYAPYLGVRLNANDAFTKVALEDRSLSERDYLVQGTLQIWSEHPWLGVGLGALPEAQRIHFPDPDKFGANYQPAHFVLLDVAVETGIVGAIFYFVIIVAPWLALWWNRKRLIFSPALIGISGVLFAVTLVGFFDYYTWLLAPGQLWQWLAWGVWGAEFARASWAGSGQSPASAVQAQ